MKTPTNQLRVILAAVLMLIATFPALAYDFKVGDIYYNVIDETSKTVEVTYGDNKYSGSITIFPSVTYNGITYSVTKIGEVAFRDCFSLTSITMPNSVTSIGSNAFYGCIGLTSIILPKSLTEIAWGAFCRCTGLTSITIPNPVTEIGERAFSGCSGLKTIIIQNPNIETGDDAIPEGILVIIKK